MSERGGGKQVLIELIAKLRARSAQRLFESCCQDDRDLLEEAAEALEEPTK